MSMRAKILDALAIANLLTDRQLADRILGQGAHPSQVNQECRLLAKRGEIIRRIDAGGSILNGLRGTDPQPFRSPSKRPPLISAEIPVPTAAKITQIKEGEDEIKGLLAT